MTTPIFSPEQLLKYAQTRLFGQNVSPEQVQQIHLYNGLLPSELERVLDADVSHTKIIQDNGREPLFFQGETIHIPQYSGFGRRRRYEELIKAYIQTSKKGITLTMHERDNDSRKTNISYDNFAYDFVKRLFQEEDMHDLTVVIIGPMTAVARQAQVINVRKNEYLDSQIVGIGEKCAVNLNYVYADQAGIIMDKMMREYEALARGDGKNFKINVYMFGRVGGLHHNLSRQDLLFPTGIIDDIDLRIGKGREYPMHNVLATSERRYGLNLNVNSIIHETVEQLDAARNGGCMSVDMETRETVEAINRARRRYAGTLDIHFGFVGYVSDLPLQGDTLATELSSDQGERDAVDVIVKHLRGTA